MPLQHPSASDATETASIKNSSTAATATTTALVSCFSCLSFSVLIAASLGLGAAAAAAREVDPVVVFSRSGEVVTRSIPQHCQFAAALPRQYVAYKVVEPPLIDGQLDDDSWLEVPWTEPFTDIHDRPPPRFQTRAKIRWDNTWLYVAAELEEPQVWANITKHNEVIYRDNDFEVFIDAEGSNHHYKEFEINAHNATWDLCLNKPYIDNGYENSSRVFGDFGWEMQPPLSSSVGIQGPSCKLNKPGTRCLGWTVEIALPLADLAYNTTATVPPVPGSSYWRINFSRVEWHAKVEGGRYVKDELASDPDNWVWSSQGTVNMHLPEKWGILQFADGPVNSTQMKPYPEWTIRHIAMSLYDAQRAYFASSSGAYTKDLVQLRPLAPPGTLDGSCFASIVLQVSEDGQQWAAEVRAMVGNVSACIRDDRLLTLQARGTCTGILAETVGRWTEANGQRSLGNNTMFK